MISQPSNKRLKVVMTAEGKLRLDYDGEPVAGVRSIDCIDNHAEGRAEIIVTFTGLAVGLDTEAASNGAN